MSDDYQQSLHERNERSASYPPDVQHICVKTLSVPSAASTQKQTLNVMFSPSVRLAAPIQTLPAVSAPSVKLGCFCERCVLRVVQ